MVFNDLTEIEHYVKNKDYDSLISMTGEVHVPVSAPLRAHRNPLMVSALNLKHLNRLDSLETDIAVINLEDGISRENKLPAAILAALFISRIHSIPHYSGPLISVRINPLGSGGEEDLEILRKVKPHAVRVPKVRSAKDADKVLKLTDENCAVHLTVETSDAFRNLHTLRTDERITLFYLGMLDLLSDMKTPQSFSESRNPLSDYIKARFFTEVKMSGADPVSNVYQKYRNTEVFREMCMEDRSAGFRGKSCISPAQAEIAAEVFSPDAEETERAEYIKSVFEENASRGITGFRDETYGFIDEPVYRDALIILETVRKSAKQP